MTRKEADGCMNGWVVNDLHAAIRSTQRVLGGSAVASQSDRQQARIDLEYLERAARRAVWTLEIFAPVIDAIRAKKEAKAA